MFVPFAKTIIVGRKAHKVCPTCGEHVALKEKKDFESYSGKEYVEHFKAKHPEQVVTSLR